MLKAQATNLKDAATGPAFDLKHIGAPGDNPPAGQVYKALFAMSDSQLDFTTLNGTALTNVIIPKGCYLFAFIVTIDAVESGSLLGLL